MKILFSLVLFFSILNANAHLTSIYDNILLHQSKEALHIAQKLKKEIETHHTPAMLDSFKALVAAWKKVEAFYILGDLNEAYLDTPRYIDVFHQGNESLSKQLQHILSGKEKLQYALYKNSHKTINALEYILFSHDMKNPRVQESALLIIATIISHLEEIYQGYKASKSRFIEDELNANAIMLNQLIESSYKLKEWRVGDPTGLSRKFKNKPDNRRAEYFISKHSIVAIQAILETHQMVLSKQEYKNFGSLIQSYGVTEPLKEALQTIDTALKQSSAIENENFLEAKTLFKSLKKLHTIYYITLISKLKITAKILDADGD